MSEDKYDYSGLCDESQDAEALAGLRRRAFDLVAAKTEELKCETALKRAKARVKQMEEKDLPSEMQRLGLTTFGFADGLQIDCARAFHASLPKEDLEKRHAALAFIRSSGNGGLIKNHIVVELGKEHDEKATALVEKLTSEGYEVARTEDVHAGTLKKWVREHIEAGKSMPEELFQVHDPYVAKVKRGK